MKENQARAAERLEQMARYGVHSVKDGSYNYLPEGKLKSVTKPIAGASAEYESGANIKRATLTRVGAGALLFGPLGAVGGVLMKKNTTKGYVTVIFADGDTVIIEGPLKDEPKMRKFAVDVNRIARA